jgi:hypothetical protein
VVASIGAPRNVPGGCALASRGQIGEGGIDDSDYQIVFALDLDQYVIGSA